MSLHPRYEQDMREMYGLQMLYVHEAYWELVVHALIDVGATFSWLGSYDERPYVFWIKESPASTWPNESYDMQKQIDRIRGTLTYPYVHVTPDREYILINSVSPDGVFEIERC